MIFINFSLSHYVSKKDDRCYTNNWIFRDSEIMMDICNWWAKLYIYDILSALVHTFNKIIIWRNDLWSFDEKFTSGIWKIISICSHIYLLKTTSLVLNATQCELKRLWEIIIRFYDMILFYICVERLKFSECFTV